MTPAKTQRHKEGCRPISPNLACFAPLRDKFFLKGILFNNCQSQNVIYEELK